MEGINIKNPDLEHWRPLLREWISLINKYCSKIYDDPVYCHLEKANVSILAAAAWKIGCMAVQELWVERQGHNTFCDLWIWHENEEPEYIEAKIEETVEKVKKCLSDAEKQINKLDIKEENRYKRISLCFIVPSIKKQSDIEKEIGKIIDNSFKIKSDILAWCFPPGKTREYTYDNINIKPGILLFANKC